MKIIENFRKNNGWFLDKNNSIGSLTMAFRNGASVSAQKHFHRTTHEYYIVLEGSANLNINGNSIILKPNSVLIVEPGEIHSLTDASEDFKVILIMEKYVPDDKVII